MTIEELARVKKCPKNYEVRVKRNFKKYIAEGVDPMCLASTMFTMMHKQGYKKVEEADNGTISESICIKYGKSEHQYVFVNYKLLTMRRKK